MRIVKSVEGEMIGRKRGTKGEQMREREERKGRQKKCLEFATARVDM